MSNFILPVSAAEVSNYEILTHYTSFSKACSILGTKILLTNNEPHVNFGILEKTGRCLAASTDIMLKFKWHARHAEAFTIVVGSEEFTTGLEKPVVYHNLTGLNPWQCPPDKISNHYWQSVAFPSEGKRPLEFVGVD